MSADLFKSLCAELEEAYAWCIEEYMTAPAEEDTLIQRARALLAQPEPVAPTDEKAWQWYSYCPEDGIELHSGKELAQKAAQEIMGSYVKAAHSDGWHEDMELVSWGMLLPAEQAQVVERTEAEPDSEFDKWVRYELVPARWGTPAIQPVPVSERLPGPEDCTAQGWCWVLYRSFATWTLEPPLGEDGKHTGYTHWLPHWALPVPAIAAQPEPVAPTDEELIRRLHEINNPTPQPVAEGPTIPSHYGGHEIAVYRDGFHAGYKEALARSANALPTPEATND
jgi:hypothetical protein